MAIANYSALVAAVTDWLHRPDIPVALCVTMGEAYINRKLEVAAMTTTATGTLAPGASTLALPARCKRVLSVAVDGTDMILSPGLQVASYPAAPRRYEVKAVIGLDAVADKSYGTQIEYLKKWDIEADASNWLLAEAPDAYLYAALMHAQPYAMNDARLGTMKPMLDEILAQVGSANPVNDSRLLGCDYAA